MTALAKIPCKDIDDIDVGKIYIINFDKLFKPIKNNHATDSFIKKYHKWGNLDDKRVLILEKTDIAYATGTIIPVLKFTVLPITNSRQNKTDSLGEWCLCSARYLYKQAQNHANCTCDLWITGCICGVFKSEQSKKK
jgi:hypothetical protein